MLNPFVQFVQREKDKGAPRRREETIAEMYGHSVDTSSPHPSMGLWVGKLLIRMGEKLAKQDMPLETDRENV